MHSTYPADDSPASKMVLVLSEAVLVLVIDECINPAVGFARAVDCRRTCALSERRRCDYEHRRGATEHEHDFVVLPFVERYCV